MRKYYNSSANFGCFFVSNRLCFMRSSDKHNHHDSKNNWKDDINNNLQVLIHYVRNIVNKLKYKKNSKINNIQKKVHTLFLDSFDYPHGFDAIELYDIDRFKYVLLEYSSNFYDKTEKLKGKNRKSIENFFQDHANFFKFIVLWVERNPHDCRKIKEIIRKYMYDVKIEARQYRSVSSKNISLLINMINSFIN
jgi:hypothetical protein